MTGADSGIGRATALAAALSGLNMAVWDIDERGAAATVRLVKELGGKAVAIVADVADKGRAQKELKALLRRGLVAETETETSDAAVGWRQDGDIHFGLTITDAGKGAINLGPDDGTSNEGAAAGRAPSTTPSQPRSASKVANVLALLGRAQGATLAELVEASGWLPHTTRAALTGLKKKGHVIEKTKRDETTCYQIAGGN